MATTDFEGVPITNGKFETEFKDESPPIGCGRFGIVVKATNKTDNQVYAIKKMIFRNAKDFDQKKREIEVWAKITHDYLVQFKGWWVEKYDAKGQDEFIKKAVQDLKEHIPSSHWKQEKHLTDFAVLHIQMELCDFSLKEGLRRMKAFFNITQNNDLFTALPYFIASEFLIETLECIHYLHTRDPPVLHRDIKPENILIKPYSNGRVIKIGDYGMAVLHEHPELSHTQMRGTIRYMAPEVMTSRYYDTKADIYSIGVMIQELFNFDINFQPPDDMSAKYENLINFTEKAMSGQRKARPSCEAFLSAKGDWSIGFDEVKGEIENTIDLSQTYDIQKDFIPFFLKTKYEFNTKK